MSTTQAKLVLEWCPEYSVRHEQLDSEHQRFFQLVRNLYEAIRVSASRAVIGAILGELYAYSVSHMTHEEDILEECGYPELASHRAEHKQFRKKIRDYMDEFESGNTAIALSLLQFLQDWLRDHLVGADQRYAALVCKQRS